MACTLTEASCISNVVHQGEQLHVTAVSYNMYDGVCDDSQSTDQELSFLRVPQVDLAIQSSRCQQLAIRPVRQGQHIVAVLQCLHSSFATAQSPYTASGGQQDSAAFTAWRSL